TSLPGWRARRPWQRGDSGGWAGPTGQHSPILPCSPAFPAWRRGPRRRKVNGRIVMRPPLRPGSAMNEVSALWYVRLPAAPRLPAGRVCRAAAPSALREHVGAGHIPPGTLVRRPGDEGWRRVEQARELGEGDGAAANGVTAGESATVAARLDPTQLHLVGVR